MNVRQLAISTLYNGWADLISISGKIASGMGYLSSQRYVRRDASYTMDASRIDPLREILLELLGRMFVRNRFVEIFSIGVKPYNGHSNEEVLFHQYCYY